MKEVLMNLGMDMNAVEMKTWAETKKDNYPRSTYYDENIWRSPNQSGSTEKEHCIAWLEAQEDNRPAKDIYDCLHCVALVLWIAEAAGVDDETVRAASDAAEKIYTEKKSANSATAAAKDIISWDMVVKASQSE